jgi:fucose 4-O-acetylase-like acetyltransferase
VSTAPPARTRLGGLDSLKGIAIILVVLIHASPSGAPDYERYVISGIARLAVPLFLVISGFLIGSSRPPRAKLVLYFWKFVRLHLLYSAFYWALEALGFREGRPLTLKNALMHFAAFAYAGQFYLFILPQIYFLFAFLIPERLRSTTGLLVGSLLLSTGCVAFLAASVSSGSSAPLPWIIANQAEATLVAWLFTFTVGIWMGARSAHPRLSRSGAVPSLLFAIMAATLAALDLPATDGVDYVVHFPYARWSILIGTALLAAALPWASRSLRLGPVEAVGRETFGIFVFNPVILGILVNQLGSVATLSRSFLYAAATVGIAYSITRLLRRRIPFAFP